MVPNITIEEIARFAQVSVSTVSRVINQHPDVSNKTRQRVLQVIEQNHYVPNNSARNLKRESMHAVAVVVKGFTNPFFTPMMESIQEELTRRRYTALLHPVSSDEDEIDSAISLNKEKKPKGLVLLGGNFQHTRQKLALLDVPYVMVTMTIHSQVDRSSFSSIAVDDYGEGYRLGERIWQAGHRRVALIGYIPQDRSISKLRTDGLRTALLDQGGRPGDCMLDYAATFTMEGGYQAANRLLDRRSFTCLFCISDIVAIGAMRAIHERGFRVPEDVSVVGFDGIPAARYSIPSLATMRQPSEEMAREAVRMLINHLERGDAHRHRILRAEFVEGESFRPLSTILSQPDGAPAPAASTTKTGGTE